MATPAHHFPVIRFGTYELYVTSGELRKSGILLKLHPQPCRLLLLLLEKPGKIVSREQIQRCLWADPVAVDSERGINFCVNQIRGVLGDHAEHPRYIETVPRHGYRFIAAVSTTAPAKTSAPEDFQPH